MTESVNITQLGGGKATAVPSDVYGVPFNSALVHQVVVAFRAGTRQGSVKQKGRGEVRGGGRKPWQQKKLGRARAGSIRSPLWRGGGRHFPVTPKNHSVKVNRKMYRGALRAILSELSRREALVYQDAFKFPAKTKEVHNQLTKFGIVGKKILFVVSEYDESLMLGIRNIPYIGVCEWRQLDPDKLVWAEVVIFEKSALEQVQNWLQ